MQEDNPPLLDLSKWDRSRTRFTENVRVGLTPQDKEALASIVDVMRRDGLYAEISQADIIRFGIKLAIAALRGHVTVARPDQATPTITT